MKLPFSPQSLPTPSYVIDYAQLEQNLQLLAQVSQESGCKILLAQKAFSTYRLYPLIGRYLHGTTASGLYEARLGHEHLGKETHVFSPGYTQQDFPQLLELCNHLVFNSFAQWNQFKTQALAKGKQCGLRINPQHSTQQGAIYDPCAPFSRLGVTASQFQGQDLSGLTGLHFHTLCEQDAPALAETLEAVEQNFAPWLKQMQWVNMGGGHHITKPGYQISTLVKTIQNFRKKYGVEVYLEPGEAVALNAGYLVSTVLDIVENEKQIAILDASAACHMPDVLEMPYRPPVVGGQDPGKTPYSYLLAGPTCLAGDQIGEYSFQTPLSVGDQVIFADMAIYTMVKNNTFNGMKLPSIYLAHPQSGLECIKSFNYEDFKQRLS